MTRIRAAARHISLLWLGSLGAAGLAFTAQVLLARHLPTADYGSLAAALATVNLAAPLAAFGIGAYWLRAFGAEGWQARRWLRPSLRFIALSTAAAAALVALWAGYASPDPLSRAVLLWLLPLLAAQAAIELVNARFQLEERYSELALWQLLSHGGRFLVVLAAVALGLGLLPITIGYAAVAVAIVAGAVWLLGGMLGGRLRLRGHPAADALAPVPAPVSIRQVPQQAWPFALGAAFYLIYFQSDIVLLHWLSGAEAAGIYNVAFTVLAAVYLLPGAIYQKYLLPKLHRWAEHDRDRFLAVFRTGNGSMLLLGLIALLGLALAAPRAVPWLFGPQYAPAGALLLVLALAVPARFLSTSVGGVLVTRQHMRRKVLYMGAVAVFNVGLNLLLIPPFGYYGAAVATLLSEILLLALYLLGARRHIFGAAAWRGWNIRLKTP